jgi:ABC-2 type transport system ATP-binding protein
MDDVAIKVENVSKIFRLPHEKNTSIKSTIINFWRHDRTYEKLQALNDVSFEIKQGEFFGIVGRNGSGKSTLLKILAGIYQPTSGQVHVNGKLVPFIELGVGFNPELTGRENVYLNGALLGFNRKEMAAMYKDIVEFAELERFMDQKLKNYSSGMQVRLAFSIAIRAKGDILELDEVLAVGDEAFQIKCVDHFIKLKQEKKTVILATHQMKHVEQFCDRALVLDQGKIVKLTSAEDASKTYSKLNENK